MNMAAKITVTERLGRTSGRAWRACARLDRRANGWLVAQGWAPGAARAVLTILKLAVLGLLVYAAFWLAVLLMIIVFAAWVAPKSNPADQEEWAIGEQAEHKRSVFYDPINYDDDPDPRFHEKQ
jgi:hypothetical protein